MTVRGTLNAMRYCQQILTPHILPFVRLHNVILQQYNARCHTARFTRDLLQDVLVWPARSPDLSPIEHMWDVLGRRVHERGDVRTLADLERALHEEWVRIPVREVNKLINSMRKRCVAVIAANGGHTRY